MEPIIFRLPDGTEAGQASVSQLLHGLPMKAGQVFLQVDVKPEYRHQGIGDALCRAATHAARTDGATSIACSVAADDEESLAFARKRGFRIDYVIVDSELDLSRFDLTTWQGAVAAAEAHGVCFTTLLQVQDEPGLLQKLYKLDEELSYDVPEWSGVMPPFDDYCALLREQDPQGSFIALKGDEPVGYTITDADGYTSFMGVLPAHRGQGIALALKLLTIGWAQSRGIPALKTNNNAANAAILGLNRKLGYTVRPGTIYLVDR